MSSFLSAAAVAEVYDRICILQDTQSFYEDPALQMLLRYGDFEHARSVYEAGCGTGRVGRRLLRDVLPGNCRYLGADISPRMLKLASSRTHAWPNASIVPADITAFRPESGVDRVLSLFVVDLMPDHAIAAFFNCAHDSLDEGGLLCVAGLAEGSSGIARVVSQLWKRVHDVMPAVVGGCRPGSVLRHLHPQRWRILQAQRTCTYGVCSEAVVAAKA